MKLYLNSCEPTEIKDIAQLGILDGVTMNPTMVGAIKRDYVGNLREICSIAEMDVFAQVVSDTTDGIVEEAKALSAIHPCIIVKVHSSIEGIKAICRLKKEGIHTCATAIHSTLEAVAAGRAGADHAAIFTGPIGEMGETPDPSLIASVRAIYDHNAIPTQIMAAVRHSSQVVQGLVDGADEFTCSYKVWKLIFENAFTVARWKGFISDWRKAYGDRNWITGF